MATFIITGNYTVQAIQGMIANPSDRAAGASGTVSNLKTVRAYSSADFTASQKKAAGIAAKFKPAG